MMEAKVEELENGRLHKVSIWHHAQPLLYAEVIDRWQHDEAFRTFYIGLLRKVPYPAYFWETPPVTARTVDQPFEFVQVNSPQLARVNPHIHAFRSYFQNVNAETPIVSFANLGGDAYLIVPCPLESHDMYTQIGVFTQKAPMSQQHALWRGVGEALTNRLSEKPIWVSTSGLGVYWLHIRLDSYPKYYTYQPYRQR